MNPSATLAGGGISADERGASGAAAGRRAGASKLAFAAVLAIGAAILLIEMHGMSFLADEWDFIVLRRGFSAHVLLTPHNEHLSLVPILVFKAMLAIFGMRSYVPYIGLAALDLVLVGVAVGFVCRSWWGPWWGVVPVFLIATLGAGGETWLWPFQVGLVLATVAGIIALAAIARDHRRWDILACAALTFSLFSGSQGIGALVGAIVMLALSPGRWRRAWVAAVPLVLYGLWFLDYGRQANHAQLGLWTDIPLYVIRSLSATISGVVGLSQLHGQAGGVINMYYGLPIAIALLVAAGVALLRGWRPPALAWGLAATLLALWITACLNNVNFERPATAPRYLPVNAALLLTLVCVAIPQPRIGRSASAIACAMLAIVAISNIAQYSTSRNSYRTASVTSRGVLGGMLLTRGVASPLVTPRPAWGPPAFVVLVTAGNYFSAVDSFGSNAYTAAGLRSAPQAARRLADSTIVAAEEIKLSPAAESPVRAQSPRLLGGSARTQGGCLVLASANVALVAPAGGLRIDAPANTPVNVRLSRFSSTSWVSVGQVLPHSSSTLWLPTDRAPQIPWHAQLNGAGARVCALGPRFGTFGFVTSAVPADGASGVSPTAKLLAAFSRPMDRASLARAFSLVRSSDRQPVQGTLTVIGDRTPIFTPAHPLARATRYTATISGAARDSAGHGIVGLTRWSFTTSG